MPTCWCALKVFDITEEAASGLCSALSLYMVLSQELKENQVKIAPVPKLAEGWFRWPVVQCNTTSAMWSTHSILFSGISDWVNWLCFQSGIPQNPVYQKNPKKPTTKTFQKEKTINMQKSNEEQKWKRCAFLDLIMAFVHQPMVHTSLILRP